MQKERLFYMSASPPSAHDLVRLNDIYLEESEEANEEFKDE